MEKQAKTFQRLLYPEIGNTVFKEKNKVRGLALLVFKTHYKAIVVKTVVIAERIDTKINRTE